ncbi:hypothetical protein EC957_002225 [Mortierella hygrophila]|uniref:Uncharacterized protein n=1 Tax=Mortierella hygrophila TaxID=979708 RepID=A0A9P6F5I6_9FUNG|nr:hypothetical protein EC957_002225 [Mortierella hygrophila]
MGIFQKPLLQARYDNEDVQISAELCSNITINVVGLAKGEITIVSGNEDMIQIRTSVQAKGAIIKNAAALEPLQDGNQYRYTIHTPLEDKLEKAVTFQVFVTIPRQLDSLESFTIEGANLDLAIGDIGHTFIRCLNINIGRGDTNIDGFYGELATINNTNQGGIIGKFSVARLVAHARSGKINANVHLLNTDDQLPSPRVICSTANSRLDLEVDGSDIFGPFTVEAKTQCSPLEVKLHLSETTAALVAAAAAVAPEQQQRVLGNFINFGGATRIQMSRSFQGRLETRTHYGKIFVEDPEFSVIEDAVLTLPSASDRNAPTFFAPTEPLSIHSGTAALPSPGSYLSNVLSSRSSSQGTTTSSWGGQDDHHSVPPLSPASMHSQQYLHFKKGIYTSSANKPPSAAGSGGSSTHGSEHNSRAESTTGSLNDGGSPGSASSVNGVISNRSEKQRKREEEEWRFMTREVIGTYGQGVGLIMAKNSSGDIAVELF